MKSMRTHTCGELREEHIGKTVSLCGRVQKYRNLGKLHFVDIRDRYGITQLGFEEFSFDHQKLKELSLESCLRIEGVVKKRPESALNKNMQTGQIEVQVKNLEILSKAEEVPFLPHGQVSATEDLMLKYRYLQLRSKKLQNLITLRSDTSLKVRNFFSQRMFQEVETPILYKTTPEGARDYIVPSRVHKGHVYALPQSPQTLKQLLMIGDTDRYFQLSRCFRDEDLRADRQPEFTQIDLEMSYITQDSIKSLMKDLMSELFPNQLSPMIEMTYKESMDKYGSDKPDLRYGLIHHDVTDYFANSDFSLFSEMSSGLIKGIFLPNSLGTLARKEIDALKDIVAPFGGKGVAWFKQADTLSGGISKFIKNGLEEKFKSLYNEDGLWLFCASMEKSLTHKMADALRRHLAEHFKLTKMGEYQFAWINEFPLFELNDGHLMACHHPFTMPQKEDMELFLHEKDKAKLTNVRAIAYDLVCNGYELGSGSLRIFQSDIQSKMFDHLNMSEEEVTRQFGFFIEALKYGTPPHGGMALGLDRIMMLLGHTHSMRDVIAFPKTAQATDLMAQAPSLPNKDQLEELSLRFE